jgi:uncharacterized membrane protein YeaQ/YmgE (transglycosylase-associated protein family)
MTCPDCGTTRVHRSRRQGFFEQVILGTIGVYPYRCSDCKKRFMKMKNPAQSRRRSIWSDPPGWLSAIIWGLVATAIALVIVGVVAYRAGS